MTSFGDDLTPRERRAARDEFVDMAQEEQIAEGDITVSETVSGQDPTPDLDDIEIEDEVWGDDDLIVLDEDDPQLAFDYDEEDDYLDEDEDED